jgi:hypothetical protein
MKKILPLSAITTIFLLGSTHIALAADIKSLVPCGPGQGHLCTLCDFVVLAHNIFWFILKISFAAAILFVAIAGILYIVSAGSEQLMTTAKSAMTYALMGFGFCLGAWLLVQVIASSLGYSNWNTIAIKDCPGFAIDAMEHHCDWMNGNWDPATGKCNQPAGTIKYKGRYVDPNLVAKIEDCEKDGHYHQEWDYTTNTCECIGNYLKNADKNCVPKECWLCHRDIGPFMQTCEPSSYCQNTTYIPYLAAWNCSPIPSICGTINNAGTEDVPCGNEPDSTCQKNCPYGRDLWGGANCNGGLKCCQSSSNPGRSYQVGDPAECSRCSSYDIYVLDSTLGTNCTMRADGTNRLECIESGGKCVSNPNVCP